MTKERLLDHAKFLRTHQTTAENRLWYYLRNRRLKGYKFKRQVVFGNYIADFVCSEKKLIIEIDGGQHSEQVIYDEQRTRYLASLGFRVLRFWNTEILFEINAVLEVVLKHLNEQ